MEKLSKYKCNTKGEIEE